MPNPKIPKQIVKKAIREELRRLGVAKNRKYGDDERALRLSQDTALTDRPNQTEGGIDT